MNSLLAGAVAALTVWGVAGAAEPAITPVYGVKATADGITIRVPPLGSAHCAPVRGLATVALDKRAGGATLLLAWQVGGKCAPGQTADLSWTWRELGLKPGDQVRIANPLVAEPGA